MALWGVGGVLEIEPLFVKMPCNFFFFKILFIHLTKREHKQGKEQGEREKQTPAEQTPSRRPTDCATQAPCLAAFNVFTDHLGIGSESVSLEWYLEFFISFFKVFKIYLWGRERQREREGISSRLSAGRKAHAGLHLTALRP